MLKRFSLLIIVVLPLLALGGYAAASSGNERSAAAQAAAATARFHDLDAAEAAGYTVHVQELSGATCIANGAVGAMGDHFANGTLLVDDGVIDASAPEALVYEQRNNGTYKLVALEYIVFQADWQGAGHSSPPVLFGRQFDFTDAPNRYGLPPFYSLHAWIWKPNPSGLLFPWNPDVTCS
jgi:hypothetical protein